MWLRQRPEEGEGAADAQPAPGGEGGDTEAKVRQQKAKIEKQHLIYF